MKPDNWDRMTERERLDDARILFNSIRGKMIVAQALAVAIRTLGAAEHPEISNIEDMEEIGETLFEPFYSLHTNPRSPM